MKADLEGPELDEQIDETSHNEGLVITMLLSLAEADEYS